MMLGPMHISLFLDFKLDSPVCTHSVLINTSNPDSNSLADWNQVCDRKLIDLTLDPSS